MTTRGHRGFTLLEVLAAVAILAIALVGVYRLHAQTIVMQTRARFDALAPMLAQEALNARTVEELARIGEDSGDFGDALPGYTWQVTTGEVESELLGDVAPELIRLDVTVGFNEGELTYALRTYRMLEPEE